MMSMLITTMPRAVPSAKPISIGKFLFCIMKLIISNKTKSGLIGYNVYRYIYLMPQSLEN